MQRASSSCYCAIVAVALGLTTGCDDLPGEPEISAFAADPALVQKAESKASGSQIPFANLKLFFEFNSTDNDLGVQLLLDGDEWERVEAFDPGKRKILDIAVHGRLGELGLTELFFESAEPSPAEVLALFPAGTYRFEGRTLEKDKLVGTATLSHNLPPAPSFSPSNGESVNRNNTIIQWNPIPGIVAFQVIVENETLGVVMTVDVKPPVTSLQVPPTFMQPNTEYKAEILAIGANGNRTIAEGKFVTLP